MIIVSVVAQTIMNCTDPEILTEKGKNSRRERISKNPLHNESQSLEDSAKYINSTSCFHEFLCLDRVARGITYTSAAPPPPEPCHPISVHATDVVATKNPIRPLVDS